MKKVIATFEQKYTNPKTKEKNVFHYHVTIVQDTTNYTYRIMNIEHQSIWKNFSFSSFSDAENFINTHPANIFNLK